MQKGIKSVYIIAEIGINHNGDLKLAKQLIDLAVLSGCDAVKFQKRTISEVYTEEFLASPRQSPWGSTQRQQKEGLEFGEKEYDELDRYCKQQEIDWFFSAWDVPAQRFMRKYEVKYNKVASPMLTHLELLEEIAKEGKLTYISTGMSTFDEIDQAVSLFKQYKCPYEIMHCNSTYPMKEEDANLNLMDELSRRYDVPIGFSSHEAGSLCTLAAVAKGADSIERHITLDKNMYGSDQKASLEPAELFQLVKEIRLLEKALGHGEKELSIAELETRKKLRG